MPPSPKLSAEGKRRLAEWHDKQVAESSQPAIFAGVATANEILYFEAKGDKYYGHPDRGQVSEDTILQLWSMTKLVTAVACLQLIEQELMDVDSPELIEQNLPELWAMPILVGMDGDRLVTRPRTRPLTLRHLLTHTSGLAYPFEGTLLMEWVRANPKHSSWRQKGAGIEAFCEPLLFEPGTKYQYSIGLDWAGILVSRISGLSLEEYFQRNIWAPLGIKDISFYPTPPFKSRMMGMHDRQDGKVVVSKGWWDLANMVPDDLSILAGGAGLLGTAKDYLRFLQHILQCNLGRTDGILKPSTARLLFVDALPPRDESNTCHQDVGTMFAIMGGEIPSWVSGKALGWSYGFCITNEDSPYGRRSGSGFWGGAARTKYWIDPKMGIVGLCGTQILEVDERPFARVLDKYERTVYDALALPAKL